MEIVVGIAVFIAVVCAGWAIDTDRRYRKLETKWREIAADARELKGKYEDERAGRMAAQEAYVGITRQQEQLLDRFTLLASREPQTIDPTPIIDSLRRVFVPDVDPEQETKQETKRVDLIAAANGQQPPASEVNQVFLPDVEFDEWINQNGMPTKGGWVNKETNSLLNPMDGQTPVHKVTQDGRLTRLDGQPMFRAGDGQQQTPDGGLED